MSNPTAEAVEAYANSVRDYYAGLKKGVDPEQQKLLRRRIQTEQNKLLMSVLIDHGQIGLIRYVNETKALLSNRDHRANSSSPNERK